MISFNLPLTQQVVECDYRQVRTTFISRFFPHNLFLSNPLDSNGSNEYHAAHPRIQRQASEVMPPTGSHSEGAFAYLAHLFSGHRNGAPMSQSPGASATSVGPSFHFGSPPNNSSVPINTAIPYTAEQFLGWDAMFSPEPSWMREAARQLHTITDAGRDWSALARRLGYSNREIRRIRDDDSQLPALSLLRDWFESNGRSSYCVDVLSSCLRLISREDVLRLLDSEKASESLASPVFLSYQSASQAAALQLRRRLELNGFGCWMDVQQMSGGDQLFTRIYDGLARCRLVICCLTARYCASRTCVRELTLADALHKPILPLLLEPLPWPPPGPLALILSPLLYVDLCGVGGHGGIGRRQDRESRMREIVERVGRYVSEYAQMPAVFGRPLPLPDLFSQVQQPSGGRLGVDPPLSAMYAARLGSGHSGNSDRSMSSHQTDTFDETNVPHRSPSAHHDSDQPSTSTGERHLDTVQPIEDDDDDDDDEDLDILSNRDRLNSRVHHNRNDSNSANQTTHASDSDSNNERNTQHLTPGQASTSVQTQTASPLDNPVASTAHAAIHTRSVSTSPEVCVDNALQSLITHSNFILILLYFSRLVAITFAKQVDSVITITRESASSSTSAPPHESAVQSALAEAPRTNNRISNCSICCIS